MTRTFEIELRRGQTGQIPARARVELIGCGIRVDRGEEESPLTILGDAVTFIVGEHYRIASVREIHPLAVETPKPVAETPAAPPPGPAPAESMLEAIRRLLPTMPRPFATDALLRALPPEYRDRELLNVKLHGLLLSREIRRVQKGHSSRPALWERA